MTAKASSQFKQRILKGGSWAFVGKIITALTGLTINVLLTRLLSPDDMGAYFLLLSLTSFFATVAQFGLTNTIVKLVAEAIGTNQPNKARLAIRLTVRLLGIGLLIVIYLLAYGFGAWLAEHLLHSTVIAQLVGLSAIWVTIVASQQLIAEIYRGFHDIKLATIFGGLTTSFFAMLLFLIVWIYQVQSNLQEVIFLTLIAGTSSVIISSLILWHKISKLAMPKGDELKTSDITTIASPLWITNLMLFALAQADIWMMGLFCSPEQIAIYGATARMMTLVTMPLMIINSVVPPIIAEMHAQKKLHELEEKLRMVATLSGFPSIFAIAVFGFYADSILALLFGEYYRAGGTILIILGFGQLINVWAGSCGQVLMLTGHQKTMMLITLFCGFITVIMAWFLVKFYQGIGVAIAGAIGMALQNFLMLLLVKNKLGIWTHVNLKNIKQLKTK